MSYCTQAQIEARIGPEDLRGYSDYSGDGVVDDSVVDRAIEDACALIDSYVGVRYETPLDAPVPRSIVRVAIDEIRFQREVARDRRRAEAARVAAEREREQAAGRAAYESSRAAGASGSRTARGPDA